MPNHRAQHIAKLLQEELNLLIGAELVDPRLEDAMVNVTHVVMSPDLRTARVYVEHSLPPSGSRQVLAALEHAESFLRESLTENLSIRYVPHLTFQIDTTEQRARRVDELLDRLKDTSHNAEDHADQRPQ